jgi:TonB-linked SusC/RagA family outer membrane protein
MVALFTKHSRSLLRLLCLALCVLSVSATGFAQLPPKPTVLTGTVTDENQRPQAGIAVMLVGTSVGTLTNADGNYSLNLPAAGLPAASRIRYSMLGMIPVEVEYGNRARIDVVMREDAQQIEQVVALGVANIHNRDFTGAATTLKMDSTYMPAYNSIDEMLQGQVAGMIVTAPSMRAGAAPQIMIRGRSTLIGSTEPLWVVDGIIQPDVAPTNGSWDGSDNGMNELLGSAISWLNPQDVETITVLKDASATAIYGSRASNGVIVVTTKKGSANRSSFRASYNLTVGEQPNYGLYNLMNSQQRINFSKYAFNAGVYYQHIPLAQMYTYEGMYNLFLNGELSEADFIRQYNYLETINTDWFDLTTRPSLNQNFSVSTSGGTEKASYVASVSYAKSDAPEKGNGTERYTGRLTLDLKLSNTIRVSTSLMGSLGKTTGFAGGVDPIGYASRTSRAIPAYNPDGTPAYYQIRENYKWNKETETNGLPYNFMNDLANTASRNESPNLQASIDLKWQLLPALTWQVVGGFNTQARASESWMGEHSFSVLRDYRGYRLDTPEALDPAYRAAAILKRGGILITDNTYTRSYNLRNQLNFRKEFGSDHRVTAMAMWEVTSSYRNSKYNTVFGYNRDRGELITPPTPPTELIPIDATRPTDYVDTYLKLSKSYWQSTNFTDNKASLAMIGAYTFKERYVLNANFRNDWSNSFGQNANRRFNPAWSVGVSWRLADEPFMASQQAISSANFRLTYGTQGNVSSTQTSEMVLKYQPFHPIYGDPYSLISRIANPFMSWERTENWNAGVDLGLFDNRITLVVDGYTRRSDAGTELPDMPENGGFQTVVGGTIVRNTGFEATVSVTPLQTRDWRVTLSANFSKNWNTLVSQEQVQEATYNLEDYLGGKSNEILVEGYPLGSFWAFPYAGPDAKYGIPTFHNFHAGAYTEEERAKHPTDLLTYAGTNLADITSGLTLRVSYKKLTLTSMFAATLGGKKFLYNPYSAFYAGNMPDPVNNLNKELLGMWTPENPNSNFPGLYVVPSVKDYPLNLVDPSSLAGQFYDRYNMWAQSDERLASMSSLRCRSINLSWQADTRNAKGAPAAVLQRLGIRSVSLTAAVNNVFLIADSRWQGMDPDLGGDRKAPRSFTFGINFGF